MLPLHHNTTRRQNPENLVLKHSIAIAMYIERVGDHMRLDSVALVA
jgi:hypothetical protein